MALGQTFAAREPNRLMYNGKLKRSVNPDASGEDQQFLLNGRQLGWYDYGARFYDPELGRFHTLDPWAEKYNFQSPFAYAANNPIRYTDFMGLGPEDKVENSSYNYSRVNQNTETHTFTNTETQTVETLSKDGQTKTVNTLETTTTVEITKTVIDGEVTTSQNVGQSVDRTTETFSMSDKGWQSNNDTQTSNLASTKLGEGAVGWVKLPGGENIKIDAGGNDGNFARQVDGFSKHIGGIAALGPNAPPLAQASACAFSNQLAHPQ